jgi:hypothetical protein
VRFSQLADAAGKSGPLGYVTATSAGGFAAILTGAARPEIVPCPQLTTDAVISRGREYLLGYAQAKRAILEAAAAQERELLVEAFRRYRENLTTTASWLWDAVMRDCVMAVAGAESCFLLPGGRLASLPLHVAGNEFDSVLDHCAIRYLPSAQFVWDTRSWSPRAFLGCGDPIPRDPILRESEAELTRAAQHFDSERSQLLIRDRATQQCLLPAMATADVVQFWCHGGATPMDPRKAFLKLTDGPLSVMDIEMRAALRRHPLIVLAACETARFGVYAIDELVGLPLAWLETGAGAVVAPQWVVEVKEAGIVLRSFYSHWREDGVEPWQALRLAMKERRDALGRSASQEDPITWAAFTFWG